MGKGLPEVFDEVKSALANDFRAFNPSKHSQFSKLTIFVNLAQIYTNMILTKVPIFTHLIHLGSSRRIPKLLFISNRVVYKCI